MRRFSIAAIMFAALFALGACVVLFPLEPEEDIFNPPRFLRDYCLPEYTQSVVVDSEGYETILLVVEDLDVDDGIEFRIFKDYYECGDSAECHLTLLAEGEIPSAGDNPEYGKYTRTFEYPIKKSRLCSKAAGDSSNTEHTIEVVITDAFVRDSNIKPFWRKGTAGSDVWSFIVKCVDSGFKSKEAADDPDEDAWSEEDPE